MTQEISNTTSISEPQFTITKIEVQCNEHPLSSSKHIDNIELYHKLFDDIIQLSNDWGTLDINELLIHNIHELKIVREYRALLKLKNDMFTKEIADNLISTTDKLFESRNNNKVKHKKKSFFGKNKS